MTQDARRTILVRVFDGERHAGDWPPEKPAEFMAWWQAKIDQIPEEFRDGAKVEIAGSDCPNIEISYWRPETDAEFEKRRAEREATRVVTAQQLEAAERATYERLKAKYGAPQGQP